MFFLSFEYWQRNSRCQPDLRPMITRQTPTGHFDLKMSKAIFENKNSKVRRNVSRKVRLPTQALRNPKTTTALAQPKATLLKTQKYRE